MALTPDVQKTFCWSICSKWFKTWEKGGYKMVTLLRKFNQAKSQWTREDSHLKGVTLYWDFTLFPEFSMVSYCSHYILTRFHGPRVLEKSVPSIAWGACTTRCVICDEKCGSVEWDPVFGLMPCMSACLSLLGGPWVLKWCLSCRVVVLVQTFPKISKSDERSIFLHPVDLQTCCTFGFLLQNLAYLASLIPWWFSKHWFLGKKRQLFGHF